jgi:hypothetical protein
VRREAFKWVWLGLLLADVFWEVTAFFVHGEPWSHLTLSQIVKRWEGIDPVTGEPTFTPVGIVKRFFVGAGLLAAAAVLFAHWVYPQF